MDLEYKVTGLAELDAALRDFTSKLQRRYLSRALRAGAKVIQAEARSLIQNRTGLLARSIVVRSARRDGAASRISVGVRKGGKKSSAFYARYVELGTRAHEIKPKRGALAINGRVVRAAKHPGSRAKPFLRPALERSPQRIIDAFAAELRRQIDHG